jgi:glucose/arabinose dehydrogenase
MTSRDLALVPTTRLFSIAAAVLTFAWQQPALADPPGLLLTAQLAGPESAVAGPDGRYFISSVGLFDEQRDGTIQVFPNQTGKPFATGLNDPKGLVFHEGNLYVTDVDRVCRVNMRGEMREWVTWGDFPEPPKFLNDIAVDLEGNFYVSDTGDFQGTGGAVYRISPDEKVSLYAGGKTSPGIKAPNGLLWEDEKGLLILDWLTGELFRVARAGAPATLVAAGFPGGDGLARDVDGNLYASSYTEGKVWVVPAGSAKPELFAEGFRSASDISIDNRRGQIVLPDMEAGTLSVLPIRSGVPAGVDQSPLIVAVRPMFTGLEIHRPIVLTHAGDGSNRIFIASQLGKVVAIQPGSTGEKASLFLDLEPKVTYKDHENEEGFLGMAFHPQFKANGQLFVYYTTRDDPHVSVISRFTVEKDEPNRCDPATEEELLRIPQPFWNHNGGTIAFGPDGYLYISLGDGGAANDPHGNGQNLKTLLGSMLRIDVDHRDAGKAYAIPKDNPFVGRSDACPEIWAYGLRNVWRHSFDRNTGTCWAADVGQDIWEEINVIEKGGNYGWNKRESMHRFRADGAGRNPELIDPIWEYHHDVGKSITGGHVYRGKKVPALSGLYLYADYVTGRLWGLSYDLDQRKVLANRLIAEGLQPVMSFGEDEAGELYFMTTNGQVWGFE